MQIEKIIENFNPMGVSALIMFDLDNLKQINDTYGHKWEDIYIKSAVVHLSKIGGTSGVLGRRSGDEFVLFLFGFKDKHSVRQELNKFYEGLGKELMNFPDGSLKAITISSGLLWIEDYKVKYDELLHKADSLLYNAKNLNKGYFVESS